MLLLAFVFFLSFNDFVKPQEWKAIKKISKLRIVKAIFITIHFFEVIWQNRTNY